jgi:hypothetical protein
MKVNKSFTLIFHISLYLKGLSLIHFITYFFLCHAQDVILAILQKIVTIERTENLWNLVSGPVSRMGGAADI